MSFKPLCALLASLSVAASLPAHGAERDPEKLPITRVRDLHYGDVLFHFYQDDNFESLTRLGAYERWGRLPSHLPEARLLEGGLYLSLGLHNEAGKRFEELLTPEIPAGVRNRAWFYLGKVWYARGYLDRAESALRSVATTLPPELESEKLHLLANVYLRQGRFDDAIALLNNYKGSPDWLAYARFNVGVALIRQNRLEEADFSLSNIGMLETSSEELLALRDKANLALGFAYLQAEKPGAAKVVLERVRLNGPYSTKALLGAGWAQAALGEYRQALVPWLELRDRNLLDSAVQESYLAVPYAYAKLEANAQAAEFYEAAMLSFDNESASIDGSIERIRTGRMLDTLLESEEQGNYGWFWQLKSLPDAPESRYLYTVLAGNDFQEGLKNYRDLAYMRRTLTRWSDSMDAFDNMVDARQRAYDERVPRTDALLATKQVDDLSQQKIELQSRLADIERRQDAPAIGTAQEREQWARIQRLEQALADGTAGVDPAEIESVRARLRLVKGVLSWRLGEAFKARIYQEKRDLKDLDSALREAQRRWVRVERARTSVTNNTGEFESRIVALNERLGALQQRLLAVRDEQNEFLERAAIAELELQKDRLAAYRVQARFALATIYDRAANTPTPAPGSAPMSPAGAPVPAEGAPVSPEAAPVLPEAAPPEVGP